MATFTMFDTNRFPPGQSVAIYPATNWPNGNVDQNSAPLGSATDTQTMGTNNLTFTGLTSGTQYVAYALVNGAHRYTFVRPPASTDAQLATETLDSDGTLAANSDARVPTQKAVKTYSDTTKAGRELGYAEITSNATTTNAVGNDDIAGLTTTVTVGSRPIIVTAWAAEVHHSVINGAVVFTITEGSTILAFAWSTSSTAAAKSNVVVRARLAPSAGAHTYKCQMGVTGAGTGTLTAAATTPAHIQVVEV